MRLPILPSMPYDLMQLVKKLQQLVTETNQQVNSLTEGHVSAVHNAATSAPTTGTWKQGDVVRNSTPAELGAGGSKYVITAWVCVTSGTPGTWLQLRSLTGN